MTDVTDQARQDQTQTDWKRLRSMTDEDIARAVADDPDAAPIPTENEVREYKPVPARTGR